MKIDVKKIAELANLPLTEEEQSKLESQLEETLNYIKSLEKIDTTNVEPTSQITGLENITREDISKPSLSQTDALSNAASTQNGFFKVKNVLKNE